MSDLRLSRDDAPMPSWQGSSVVLSVSLRIAAALAWLLTASIPPALALPERSAVAGADVKATANASPVSIPTYCLDRKRLIFSRFPQIFMSHQRRE